MTVISATRRQKLKKVLHDPLIHFLFAGCIIFLTLSIADDFSPQDEITVNKESLLTFIQYRNKTFNAKFAQTQLNAMSPEDLRSLIADYTREEALFREAIKAELMDGDYVIRQRLVGKMAYLAEPNLHQIELDAKTVRKYFDLHRSDYSIPEKITFRHVFFQSKGRSTSELTQKAHQTLTILRENRTSPEMGRNYGERFLFQDDYIDRSFAFVAIELGDEAAKKIFDGSRPSGEWTGPILSRYGAHLIYVHNRQPEKQPALEEIYEKVEADAALAAKYDLQEAFERAVIANYDIQISAEMRDLITSRNHSK